MNSLGDNTSNRSFGHQTIIIEELEKSLKQHEIQSLPNYYEWSLCDIDCAYADLFKQTHFYHPQRSRSIMKVPFETLSYFNCKRIGDFSYMYDRIAHGGYIYPQQHFGTSHMIKPHPMRHSIPCEERFRWMPARSSSMIGRRVHLPLDIYGSTSTRNIVERPIVR